MFVVFLLFCATYGYHLSYLLRGKTQSNADLVYRVFLIISCLTAAFVLGLSIPNDNFFQWNPWE